MEFPRRLQPFSEASWRRPDTRRGIRGTLACMNGWCGSLLDADEYPIDRFSENRSKKLIVIYDQRSAVFASWDLFV